MIHMICDRCGKKIVNNTYYTIEIHAHDINSSNDCRVSTDTFAQKVNNTVNALYGQRRELCKDCKEEIEKIINKEIKLNTEAAPPDIVNEYIPGLFLRNKFFIGDKRKNEIK